MNLSSDPVCLVRGRGRGRGEDACCEDERESVFVLLVPSLRTQGWEEEKFEEIQGLTVESELDLSLLSGQGRG